MKKQKRRSDKKTERKSTIKRLYKESFNHIKECKNFIWIIIGIFIVGAIIGLIVPLPEETLAQLIEMLKELLAQIEGKSTFEIITFIFLNNTQASIIGLIAGVLFGITPIFMALINGYLLGFISFLTIQTDGIISLWRILPHGIFELTAVFISLGMGLQLGTFITQKDGIKKIKKNFKKAIITFVLIVLPLLILAAIIEGILIGMAM